uniref:Uncharacterized protein n=1 Tax=Setaria digitata TaxID=48799 RepID=A0A915Q500_9BILA
MPIQSAISMEKRTSKTSLGGQLFLCMTGSLLSCSICAWLAAFSKDIQWRRLLFAAGAALCALLFAVLGIQTIRKAKQSPLEVTIPNLAGRRSTTIKISRKSMCESCLNREENGSGSTRQLQNSALKAEDAVNAMVERTSSISNV